MPSEIEIEISKLLSSSFNEGAGEKIGMRDLARMWSLEMQWFSPDDAYSLVERLRSSGWLEGTESGLSAAPHCFLHPPELGWRPFLPRSGNIPSPPAKNDEPQNPPVPIERAVQDDAPDLTRKDGGKLISIVSSLSGLDRREVIRRAKRKRRALGPVSMEVAVLLLAREQNLEMDELSKEFN